MDRLNDLGFLVIDGAQGDARSVVLLAAERGAQVLFTAPPGSEDEAAQVLSACDASGTAGQVSCILADLTQPSEVDRVFDAMSERLPGLNVLVVNNVDRAQSLEGKSLTETSLTDWNESLSYYLRRPFLVTQRAVDEFLGAGEGGRIVFITSAHAQDASCPTSLAVAQTALHSFVRSVTKEYGRRKMACNAVVVHDTAGGETALTNAHTAAETVLFLASAEASYVNGEVLDVAGTARGLSPI
jgi:NAD(P)-dependent dehydrogenase (short-subunit alcohol dehydrogenase family)